MHRLEVTKQAKLLAEQSLTAIAITFYNRVISKSSVTLHIINEQFCGV